MFCPKCGDKKVVDIFCQSCLVEEKPLVKSFKEFAVEVCTTCRKVKWKGTWQKRRLNDCVKEQIVLPNYTRVKGIDVEPIKVEYKSGLKCEGEVAVRVTGRATEKAKWYTEEYIFPYSVQNTLCMQCRKLEGGYFEGLLQVRNENEESQKVLAKYVKEQGASINKRAKQPNGTDYSISSRAIIEKAARELQRRFGGIVKTSAQLFSKNKQTSKNIYRVNAFIEMPPFREGDVVKGCEKILLVSERGKRIRFKNLETGKNIFKEYKDCRWERLPIIETTVVSTHPKLSVIHPETFQTVETNNQPKGRFGKHILITLDEKRLFVVE